MPEQRNESMDYEQFAQFGKNAASFSIRGVPEAVEGRDHGGILALEERRALLGWSKRREASERTESMQRA